MRSSTRSPLYLLLWPVVALGVFCLLQTWRIVVYDELMLDSRPAAPRLVDPATMSELSSWMTQVTEQNRLTCESPYNMLDELRRVPERRPMMIMHLSGYAGAMCVLGLLIALPLSMIASGRARWVPYSMPLKMHFRVAWRSLAMVGFWSVLFMVPAAVVVWFVGFDRTGMKGSLIHGLVPTLKQAVAMVLLWAIPTTAASIVFLRYSTESLLYSTASKLQLCERCRYSLAGLVSGQCPECGTTITRFPEQIATMLGRHTIIARCALAVGLLASLGIGSAYFFSPSSREWLRLRPSEHHWTQFAYLTTGSAPLIFQCLYGSIKLGAIHHPPSTGASEGSWEVAWRFTPRSTEPLAAASGSLTVSDRKSLPGKTSITTARLPFGQLRFWNHAAHPELIVEGPPLIFPQHLRSPSH